MPVSLVLVASKSAGRLELSFYVCSLFALKTIQKVASEIMFVCVLH